jgi:hypothetical protein
LAKLAGRDISQKEILDSRDQMEAWLGKDDKGRDYIIGSADGLTLLTRQWKYIEPNNGAAYNPLTHTELGNDRHEQLYDMLHDRGEYDNVAAENPMIVRFLKEILQEEKNKGIGMSL